MGIILSHAGVAFLLTTAQCLLMKYGLEKKPDAILFAMFFLANFVALFFYA